jgi:hypothetical protein
MLQDRLTSLAVLHVHRDIDIDIDRVMRDFHLYITSTVSGGSLGKFIGIKYCAWYLPSFSSNLAVSSVM